MKYILIILIIVFALVACDEPTEIVDEVPDGEGIYQMTYKGKAGSFRYEIMLNTETKSQIVIWYRLGYKENKFVVDYK